MEILYLLVPVSVVAVLAVGAIFWWALGTGQFEDLEGPAHRILLDDDSAPMPAGGQSEARTTASARARA